MPDDHRGGSVRVSIVTALHNKGPYIADTIRSVLSQSVQDWEMVVVENGSHDDGPAIVREFATCDPRVRLIDLGRAAGPGYARAAGSNAATGEWILFMDADDLLESWYLDDRLAVASAHPHADIIAGAWEDFRHGEMEIRHRRQPNGFMQSHDVLATTAFAFAPWALHAVIVKRRCVQGAEGWDLSLDKLPGEDTAFWFRVLFGAQVAWSRSSGALYRKHTNSSRDDQLQEVRCHVEAVIGTLRSNEAFLNRRKLRPNSCQAANAVRMLRAIRQKCPSNKRELRRQINSEIRYWLSHTSYADLRMVFWRVAFLQPFPTSMQPRPAVSSTGR